MPIPRNAECDDRAYWLARAEHLMVLAELNGICEVDDGTWIEVRESLQRNQVNWSPMDAAKHFDFGAAAYWLTSELGHLIPARNAKDVLDAIDTIKADEAKHERQSS